MLGWLVALPPIVGALLSGSVALVMGFSVYLVAHARLGKRASERSADLAINMFRILCIYLKPMLPDVIAQAEAFLILCATRSLP